MQKRVLDYIQAHDDEVFTYRDEDLLAALSIKPSALGFSLWALESKGLIVKETVSGKAYFGSARAIDELRARLGRGKDDASERAWANLERIRARVGNIDSQAILDEIRGVPLHS